jgi:hypothetical protein
VSIENASAATPAGVRNIAAVIQRCIHVLRRLSAWISGRLISIGCS